MSYKETIPQFNTDSASAQAITRTINRVANLGTALCDLNGENEAIVAYARLRDSIPMDNSASQWIHYAALEYLRQRLVIVGRLRTDGTVKDKNEPLFPQD